MEVREASVAYDGLVAVEADAVPVGYKRTEVGVIPEDWGLNPLGSLIASTDYGSSAKSHARGDIPVLRMGNLQGGKIDWNDLVYTSDEREIEKYKLSWGDVLFNRTNTVDLVGKTSIFDGKRPAVFAGYLIRIKGKPSVLEPRFLNFILNAEFSRKFSASVLSVAVSQANINAQKLRTYPIPTPGLAEQEAIAEALSDADALIESLEQLLAKKRQIKQGTMQELLTGKKRLPGFLGKWQVLRLDEIAQVKTGPFGSALHERDYVQSGTPIITVEHLGEFGVTNQNLPLVSKEDSKRLHAYTLETGDIVFSRVGSVDRNALIRDAEEGWLFSGRLLRVRLDKSRACPLFVSYQLHTSEFRNSVVAVAVGQTMASLNTKILNGLTVALPPLEEQTFIAEVLFDMDTEIETLEARLAKARTLKQGMMQELLTGRIRLVSCLRELSR